MTTQPMTTTTAPEWVRRVLRGNALFCAACGVEALIGGQGLATWMGIPSMLMGVLGVGLAAYGVVLWRVVETPTRAIVRVVTALDVAWIVGTMLLLLIPITDAGKIVLDAIAFITAAFAIAQTIGLRRM